jgi:GNAT superfamily N-acetyltransferase
MSAPGEVACRWVETDAAFAEAAAVFTRLMLLDPAYISHSEIQWGLSPDGLRWADDAEEQVGGYMQWVRGAAEARMAVATDGAEALLGVAVVTFETDMPGRFATVQDLVVEPQARGGGVGARLLGFVQAEAERQGCRWLFLESGVRNGRAHAFFEREGFAPTSHTFAKPLAAGSADR